MDSLFFLSLCTSLTYTDLLIPLRMKEFCVPISRIHEIILWVSRTFGLLSSFLYPLHSLYAFASVLYESWCVMIKKCPVLVTQCLSWSLAMAWEVLGEYIWEINFGSITLPRKGRFWMHYLILCSLENCERFQSKW
jgi:hypothetical protein